MGIMNRVVRIFKADVHGVMDRLEDPELLLKQHLRDMAEALNLKEVKINKMLVSRNQAQQEFDRYQQRSQKLEQDLAVALQKNRDEIARMLIRKIKPLDSLRDKIADRIGKLNEAIASYRKNLDQQRLRYDRLKHRSIDFLNKAPVSGWQNDLGEVALIGESGELSEEEIELELLKRKEALGVI